MKTNDLKKGAKVQLRNGWYADIADNAKGNIRMATVYGHYTETGSVYSHDILFHLEFLPDSTIGPGEVALLTTGKPGLKAGVYRKTNIEHTPQQAKLKAQCEGLGF